MLDRVILEKQFKHGDVYCSKICTKHFTDNGNIVETVEYALEYSQVFSAVLNRNELEHLRDAINEALNA